MRFGFGNRRLRQGFRGLVAILWVGAGVLPGVPGTAAAFQGAPASQSAAPADGHTLESVLRRMDQTAAGFRNMMANLEYTKVTVIVDDHSTEKGKIYFDKSKGKTQVMIAFLEPAEKYVLFSGDKVSLYRPKIAEVEEYSLANRKDLLEQFLLLGFGTAGQELQKAYRVSFRGEASLDGRRVLHLELTPKSPQVAAQLRQIELWISPETWQPAQQKFLEPSGDYAMARYTSLQQNAKLPSNSFKLPIRGKVKTVRPQAP